MNESKNNLKKGMWKSNIFFYFKKRVLQHDKIKYECKVLFIFAYSWGWPTGQNVQNVLEKNNFFDCIQWNNILPPAVCGWCEAPPECSVWKPNRTAGRHSPRVPTDSECSQRAARWEAARGCLSDRPPGLSAALHCCCQYTGGAATPENRVRLTYNYIYHRHSRTTASFRVTLANSTFWLFL